MNDLAIIIPAYKDKFFEKSLQSLSLQTCKDFTVYIGDDNSPFDLHSIVKKFENSLDLKYFKFNNNIGSKNLVSQWERCINLSKNEKWVWLFSDDDIAESSCVENFYFTIKQKPNRFDVYRFNVVVIDNNDRVIRSTPTGPLEETSEEMAYNLLFAKRGNSMPDHIFSRSVYLKYKGFIHTDYAQGADWAISIKYSKEKGICIIPNSTVFWRLSGTNISSTARSNRNSMIDGHLQFLNWLLDHFEYLKTGSFPITYSQILEAARFNLKAVLLYHYKGFNLNYTLILLEFLHDKLKLTFFQAAIELLKIKKHTEPLIIKPLNVLRTLNRSLSVQFSHYEKLK